VDGDGDCDFDSDGEDNCECDCVGDGNGAGAGQELKLGARAEDVMLDEGEDGNGEYILMLDQAIIKLFLQYCNYASRSCSR
jgi:hypothetical protein